MLLRRSALAAAFGIGAVIVIRSVGTYAPSMLVQIPHGFLITAIILFAGGVAQWVFFEVVSYVCTGSRRGRSPARFAATRVALVAILHLGNILKILEIKIDRLGPWTPLVESLIPLIAAVLVLVFFIFHPKSELREEDWEGRKYISSAILGSVLVLIIRVLVLVNSLQEPGSRWLSDLPPWAAQALVPVTVVGLLLIMRYMLWVYRTGGGIPRRERTEAG